MNTAQYNNHTRNAAVISTDVTQPLTIIKTSYRVLLPTLNIVVIDHIKERYEGRYESNLAMLSDDKDKLRESEVLDIYSSPIRLPEVVDRLMLSLDHIRRPKLVGFKTHQEQGCEESEWWFIEKTDKHLVETPIEPGTWW